MIMDKCTEYPKQSTNTINVCSITVVAEQTRQLLPIVQKLPSETKR